MPIKDREYTLTADLLRDYRDAALVNAQALLEEATLLLAHRKYARVTVSGATSNQGDVPIPLWALGSLATALLGIGGAFGKRRAAVR